MTLRNAYQVLMKSCRDSYRIRSSSFDIAITIVCLTLADTPLPLPNGTDAQWRRHGGKAGQLAPPPNLRSDTPRDRCRSEEIFLSEKGGVGLQYLLRRFTCTDATAGVLGLTITKKRELWKLLKKLLW